MKEEILMDLGLTKNESRVYLSLLNLGLATASQIAEKSGVHRVNVYDAIKKLKNQALVGEIVQEEKTFFQAASPQTLTNLLKEKEIKLQSLLPELILADHLAKKKVEVGVYTGYDFIRNMFLRFLEKKEAILDLGIPKFVLDGMGAHGMSGKYFQEEIHKRRAKQKQMMYHIYNSDAIERIKFLNTLPYTEGKYLPPEYDQTVTTTICGDELVIQLYFESGEKPIIISIKNQPIADAFKKYFWLIWEKGIRP